MAMQLVPHALGLAKASGQLDIAPIDIKPSPERLVVRFGDGFGGRGELARALRDLAQLVEGDQFRGDMEHRP